MNQLLLRTGIALAFGSFAGCAEFSDSSMPTLPSLPQTAVMAEPVENAFHWRADQELRAFADRHDVEAEVLLQHRSPPDARLIQQRRALARQLRVAAAQIEQGADEVGNRGESRMVQ